jgi:hypothetical protein
VPAANDDGCGNGNCNFSAALIVGIPPSTWSGHTDPIAVPGKGHPGTLFIAFTENYNTGVALSWSKFATGSKAHCTLQAGNETPVPVTCEDTESFPVTPPFLPITYTFVDTKNDPPSQDQVQTKTALVTGTLNSASITARWVPDEGFRTDDPVLVYTGTASGPLSDMQGHADSPVRCGLGGGNQYNHFDAQMTLNSSVLPPQLAGRYDADAAANGQSCGAAAGTFVLIQNR